MAGTKLPCKDLHARQTEMASKIQDLTSKLSTAQEAARTRYLSAEEEAATAAGFADACDLLEEFKTMSSWLQHLCQQECQDYKCWEQTLLFLVESLRPHGYREDLFD